MGFFVTHRITPLLELSQIEGEKTSFSVFLSYTDKIIMGQRGQVLPTSTK